jgi:hypothetical protein
MPPVKPPKWVKDPPKQTPKPPNYNNPWGQNYADMGQQYAAQYAGGYYSAPTQAQYQQPKPASPAFRNPNKPPLDPVLGYYTGNTWHTSSYGPAQSPQGYYVGPPPPSNFHAGPTAASKPTGGGGGGGGFPRFKGGGGGGYTPTARDVAAWAALVSWNINR